MVEDASDVMHYRGANNHIYLIGVSDNIFCSFKDV
jgi:hypothetical protein